MSSEEKIPLTSKDYTTPSSSSRIYRKNERLRGRMVYILIAICLLVCIAIGLVVGLVIGLNNSEDKSSTKPLYEGIQVKNAMDTLSLLQNIANQYDPPSRSILTGYDDSAEMIAKKLESNGYNVSLQYFDVPVYSNLAEGEAQFTASIPALEFTWIFLEGPEYAVMRYSGNGTVDGQLQLINGGGCDDQDYENFLPNNIVLLDYSNTDCSLYDKASNAVSFEASAVIMMRNESSAELGPPSSRIYGEEPEDTVDIPVLGATYQLGEKLLNLIELSQSVLNVHIETSTSVTMATTYNVLASTIDGREDSIIVMGSHLDSVPAGPGINDNGSGSAANLEIALALSRLGIKPKNKIIFAFWGAEEIGLRGSQYFVNNLNEQERDDIALNLNFDMIASPNYIRGVYNGSGADEIIRTQCTVIQKLFEDRFIQKDLPYTIIPFSGRSDYGSFIDPEISIPAGALATGSSAIKSEEERRIYGGFANVQLDTCYHQACDTIDNIDQSVYGEMMDAAAYALQILMMQDDLKAYLNSTAEI